MIFFSDILFEIYRLEETEETFAEFNGEDDTTAYGTV